MSNRDLKDEIDIELTRRDVQDYADLHELGGIPTVIMMPACGCSAGLDDSTRDLKCPVCGTLGVPE